MLNFNRIRQWALPVCSSLFRHRCLEGVINICATGQSVNKPRCCRSVRSMLIAMLLIIWGIEVNPGPNFNSKFINFGLLNGQSVGPKAALVHDIIADDKFDVLALTDTWMPSDAPNETWIMDTVWRSEWNMDHGCRLTLRMMWNSTLHRINIKSCINIAARLATRKAVKLLLFTVQRSKQQCLMLAAIHSSSH